MALVFYGQCVCTSEIVPRPIETINLLIAISSSALEMTSQHHQRKVDHTGGRRLAERDDCAKKYYKMAHHSRDVPVGAIPRKVRGMESIAIRASCTYYKNYLEDSANVIKRGKKSGINNHAAHSTLCSGNQ